MQLFNCHDLHTNFMTYTLFLIPDYQFQKVFYVSLGRPSNFLLVFCSTLPGPTASEVTTLWHYKYDRI